MERAGQLFLFGHDEPRFDPTFAGLERMTLEEGAWVDVARGWLAGHARMFELVRTTTRWRADDRLMYERRVDVPRLYGAPSPGGAAMPYLLAMQRALDERYGTKFERITLAYYRDGRDSVAWHGDYVARRLPDALVATVSVGSPRRFLLRRAGGGPSIAIPLGHGDLVVMGGTCQRTYQHAVPKVANAGPRIALMFRPVWKSDSPDTEPRLDR